MIRGVGVVMRRRAREAIVMRAVVVAIALPLPPAPSFAAPLLLQALLCFSVFIIFHSLIHAFIAGRHTIIIIIYAVTVASYVTAVISIIHVATAYHLRCYHERYVLCRHLSMLPLPLTTPLSADYCRIFDADAAVDAAGFRFLFFASLFDFLRRHASVSLRFSLMLFFAVARCCFSP